ncbi:hypothetical protein SAMN06272735_8792 [Streptomyces sp. TLI_55]|uniref:hypothetical protein n=1 Tax=Streptomyces sp. TLI_55 TaxID=1938861 RepID=UPI000BCF1C07|nr:hypothetical protein [Streptomyces sp. TLI_55]SNX88350.1 hypothetical protein SAMN06272735_8792 [Streptomyces sp. TLI_55]
MTEHDPDTASSPTVSRADDRIHLVHTGTRPPKWLTELAGRLSPARPSEALVVVGAPLDEDGAEALCEWLAPSLDSIRDAQVRLLTLVMSAGAHGAGGRPSAARVICERWGLDVLAAAGTALVTADGALFSPDLPGASGGWWHFSPGVDARRVSSHLPVPEWEAAVRRVGRQTVAGHVVEPVPAGLSVRPAGPTPVTAHTRPHAIPPERDRPQLILASTQVPAAALAVVVAALPEPVRAALRLLSLDGQPLTRLGEELADLLDSEVQVAVGAPAGTDSGAPSGASAGDAMVELRMVDSRGRPSWRPFARTVVCSPATVGSGRAPRVTESRPPAALRGTAAPDTLSVDGDCKVVVTPAGLWLGPHDTDPPLLTLIRPPAPESVAVDLGVPRQPLADCLWNGLETLLGRLEPDVLARVVVHAYGDLDARDRERLVEFSVRHRFSMAS